MATIEAQTFLEMAAGREAPDTGRKTMRASWSLSVERSGTVVVVVIEGFD